MTAIPPKIRQLLVCPRCRGELLDEVALGQKALVCPACRVRYPVERGIPILIVERAEPMSN